MFTFGHAQSLAKVAKVNLEKKFDDLFFYVFLLVFYISELRIRIKCPETTKIAKKRPKMYPNALLLRKYGSAKLDFRGVR